MHILEKIVPRLELMAALAADRAVVRDPERLARLREDYRYIAGVCRALLPELEPQLAELPEEIGPHARVEEKISYQMSLIRRTNRLERAVWAYLEQRRAATAARAARA